MINRSLGVIFDWDGVIIDSHDQHELSWKKLADENKVTVFQSPLLARALYFTGEIGKEISENLYSAVASVLAYIFKIERGEETDYPEFEIPENMSFEEYGKTIK